MNRKAFTLTELLIVVGILLLLATVSLSVYSSSRTTEKVRSAARIAQSAFLGAKDRALHAKEPRGIRFLRDTTNPYLCTGFAYIKPIPHDPYPAGSFTLERPTTDGVKSSSDDVIFLRDFQNKTDWKQVSSFFSQPNMIRITPQKGKIQWYKFTVVSPGVLKLSVPFIGSVENSPPSVIASDKMSAEIQFEPQELQFHSQIYMSAGVVIDFRYCSDGIKSLSTTDTADFMFSPRGSVYSSAIGYGLSFLTLRAFEDAVSDYDPSDKRCTGDCLILAINHQSGLVQTYDANLADNDGDGKADDLFSFAKAGRSAAR